MNSSTVSPNISKENPIGKEYSGWSHGSALLIEIELTRSVYVALDVMRLYRKIPALRESDEGLWPQGFDGLCAEQKVIQKVSKIAV